MIDIEWTHKGWFYFVPCKLAFDNGGGFSAEMRWTGWHWPIGLCIGIHQIINRLMGASYLFPVYVTGRL